MKGIRRVVTGIDQENGDGFSSDSPAPFSKESEILGGWAVDIWEMTTLPPGVMDDGEPNRGTVFPPAGGLVFRMVKLPPESALRANPEEATAYMGGPIDLDSDDYGMHRSDTVDLIIIMSGEVWAGMGNGDETLLKPGDTLIQRGTVHTWRNRGSEPCVMAAVLVGTEPLSD